MAKMEWFRYPDGELVPALQAPDPLPWEPQTAAPKRSRKTAASPTAIALVRKPPVSHCEPRSQPSRRMA
jgi:hypothetical protein